MKPTRPDEIERSLKRIMQVTSQEITSSAKLVYKQELSFASAVEQVMEVHEKALAKYGADPIQPLRRGYTYDRIREGLNQCLGILERGGVPGTIIGKVKPA